MIDEGGWDDRGDLAGVYLDWGGYAYGGGAQGEAARENFAERLATIDLVAHSQDNREHDVLDSDDYYQFMGGLASAVQSLRGKAPRIAHVDTSRPEAPLARPLSHEISRVVRGRAANPKWIAGVMRHGYKGAFEIAATVDYLFGFAAIYRGGLEPSFRSTVRGLSGRRAGAGFHGKRPIRRPCVRLLRGLPKRSGAGCGHRAPTGPPI